MKSKQRAEVDSRSSLFVGVSVGDLGSGAGQEGRHVIAEADHAAVVVVARLGCGDAADGALFPAGAFLAASAMSPDGDLGTGMLATGAGVALASHLLKSGSRALLNTSPEPVSNWTASVTEDVAVVGALALAFAHPWIALSLVVSVTVLFALGVWWLWRRLFRRAPRARA